MIELDAAVESPQQDYSLLDFGNGRRVERFGAYVLDRPAPQVVLPAARVSPAADWRYGGARVAAGEWAARREGLPRAWEIEVGGLTMRIELLAGGQVGLFPEQLACCRWLAARLAGRSEARVLNLFAGTGLVTGAAVRAGATVTHVDASRSSLSLARANVGEVGARWIPEDAVTFLERAARRGEAYDAVVLDAPTFGRGPRGRTWQLRRDLPRAVELIGRVLAVPAAGVWVSAHAEGGSAGELAEMLRAGLGVEEEDVSALRLGIRSEDGRRLEAGFAACTPGKVASG